MVAVCVYKWRLWELKCDLPVEKMVIADVALAVKSSCNLIKRSTKSIKLSDEQLCKKLSHVYLQEKEIEKIDDLSQCENVSVVYLQDNHITKIENLNGLKNLTHLYLQNNKIERIENLDWLQNLTKLYLSDNSVAIVENLEHNLKLSELHIENQHLGPSEQLLFDPMTVKSLSKCLQVLNISNNNLLTLLGLVGLDSLTNLRASNNCLTDLDDVCNVIRKLPNVNEIDMSLNPVCKSPHYRKKITTYATKLEILDQKEISATSKIFLQRLQKEKSVHKLKVQKKEDIRRKMSVTHELRQSPNRDLVDEVNRIIETNLLLH